MTAQNIIEVTTNKGFRLWVSTGKLMIKPKADDATRELLRQHKQAIISYLCGQKTRTSEQEKNEAKISSDFGPKSDEILDTKKYENHSFDISTELRTERAAIHIEDGGLPELEARARATLAYPCTCGGHRFWVSIHGPIVCGQCHPPAQEKLVVRWIELKKER